MTALRGIPAPKRKRGGQYNQPSRLHHPWLRVVELSSAVRLAIRALHAGDTTTALEVLARVEQPTDAP